MSRYGYDPSPRKEAKKTMVLTDRKCMSCQADFKSEGFHNRLCDKCRKDSRAMVEGGSTGRKTLPHGGHR